MAAPSPWPIDQTGILTLTLAQRFYFLKNLCVNVLPPYLPIISFKLWVSIESRFSHRFEFDPPQLCWE